jgi:hypothetical protein
MAISHLRGGSLRGGGGWREQFRQSRHDLPGRLTWTTRTTPADNAWQSVTYGDGRFVAVASSGTGNRVMTSENGFSWTAPGERGG